MGVTEVPVDGEVGEGVHICVLMLVLWSVLG